MTKIIKCYTYKYTQYCDTDEKTRIKVQLEATADLRKLISEFAPYLIECDKCGKDYSEKFPDIEAETHICTTCLNKLSAGIMDFTVSTMYSSQYTGCNSNVYYTYTPASYYYAPSNGIYYNAWNSWRGGNGGGR